MAGPASSTDQASSEIRPSASDWGIKIKTFLTALMSLLSILLVALGGLQRDVFWLWIGFGCCLVSGCFVQLFLNRIKDDVESGRR